MAGRKRYHLHFYTTNMKNIASILLVWVSLFCAAPTFAYGPDGHRIISKIAYNHLSKKARKQVDKVLGMKEGMIHASSWADEVRSIPAYQRSTTFHYKNLPTGYTPAQIDSLFDQSPKEGDFMLFAIDSLQQRLKAVPDDQDALRFLVHFMGDSHQPMHLGRKDDLGGNMLKLKWFDKDINLHSLWDSYLIDMAEYSYTEMADYLEKKYEGKTLPERDRKASLQKAYAIRERIYADYPAMAEKVNPYQYYRNYKEDMEYMLYLGGRQLANVLNEIYK